MEGEGSVADGEMYGNTDNNSVTTTKTLATGPMRILTVIISSNECVCDISVQNATLVECAIYIFNSYTASRQFWSLKM